MDDITWNGRALIRRKRYERVKEEMLEFQIIQDVEDEKEKLILIRNCVWREVEKTEKTEKVNEAVSEWLNDVNKLVKEVEICINPNRKFELYDIMLDKIRILNIKSNFKPFSTPIPGLEYFSSSDFVCFKTTKETSDELLDALKDNRSHIIGLHGTSGSGKTALAKAVGEKAKYLKIFDAVLFATVSQNSIGEIRDQLAESLNLRLVKSFKATLESMDSILVVLDDVREKLELEDISIPCNGNQCKVLLTTRCQQVCTLMNCQWEIPLQPLSEEEALILLKKYSGIDDESSSELLEMAKNVALKCNRLPRTIKDIGSSLKGKAIEEWEALLHCLTHSKALYQVFLSFRGEDTRHSFTGFLYHALCQEGFKTFMDHRLERGKPISDLFSAIKASRLSIVVLSENYASSPWCLDELVTILECMNNEKHNLLPIFYKIEPSDVRPKNNRYGEAMAKHSKKYDSERVKRWNSALYEVSQLSGERYTSNRGSEYEFIQQIVEKIKNTKNRLYIQSKASTENINDEHGEKMLNPNDSRTRRISCCGERLMSMMSTNLNNPRHTFWRCPNWKVDEEVIDEDQKKKILKLKRKLAAERRKGKLMLCVVVSWILIFIGYLGYMLK